MWLSSPTHGHIRAASVGPWSRIRFPLKSHRNWPHLSWQSVKKLGYSVHTDVCMCVDKVFQRMRVYASSLEALRGLRQTCVSVSAASAKRSPRPHFDLSLIQPPHRIWFITENNNLPCDQPPVCQRHLWVPQDQ